jgi:hypothetical protein
MNALIIGITSSLATLLLVTLFKRLDKNLFFGLILAGIGFLYVGFTWTDIKIEILNIPQAILFLLLAYYGVRRNPKFLVAGYFIHGLWDIVYSQLANTSLLPPHYDLFCSSYDFIIGIYLLMVKSDPKNL